MNNNIPKFINEKANIIKLILLTAAFALVFINIYKPFGSDYWYPMVSEFKYFIATSIITLTGVLVVVISRMIMYKYSKTHEISYLQYLFWIALEILSMSVFFTLYTYFVNGGSDIDIMDTFKKSTVNTALILLLPYSALWVYFSWQDVQNKLKSVTEEHPSSIPPKPQTLSFYDERGELGFP